MNLSKIFKSDLKQAVFAMLLQGVLCGIVVFIPMFWLPGSIPALVIGAVGFIALLGVTGWFVTSLIADKMSLENLMIITFLILLVDLFAAAVVVVLMFVIFVVTAVLAAAL